MKSSIFEIIGNTPMVKLNVDGYNFMAKLECLNIFGSMKDRAVSYVLKTLFEKSVINRDTAIIESSSGNFAIALSGICAAMNMNCICVVDNNLTNINKQIIEQYGSKIIRVDTPEKNQSYQEKRIETVKQIISSNGNTYWTNQYDNKLIQESYFNLAEEILKQCPQVERIYIPVSTCGTIAGISSWIKRFKPNVEIIAVDSYGSQIFGERIGRNRFTGMGSRIKPGNLKNAIIDKVVRVSDYECITNCQFLLNLGLFVGASSGATLAAIRKTKGYEKTTVAIFPDRGDRYLDNLYNEIWIKENFSHLAEENKIGRAHV